MIHRHYTGNKNLDEDLLRSIVHETDENPDELRFIERDLSISKEMIKMEIQLSRIALQKI